MLSGFQGDSPIILKLGLDNEALAREAFALRYFEGCGAVHVLAQLELKPGASNAALARSAFITAQTMHGIVANLEKRSLIQRKSDVSHGRILCTELTDQGHKIVTKAHDK